MAGSPACATLGTSQDTAQHRGAPMEIDLIIPSDEREEIDRIAAEPNGRSMPIVPAVGDSLRFGQTHWAGVHRTIVFPADRSSPARLAVVLAREDSLNGLERRPALTLVH